MTDPLPTPTDFLARAIDGFAPYLQASGDLHDPTFDETTQYGTAYYLYGNAVLATLGPPERRELHLDRATRGLDATLTHTADPSLPPAGSGFDPATGSVSRGNHRDFTWPPALKAFRLLRAAGSPRTDEFAERIATVDIERSFSQRPPSNWASVWLSGEWIRVREGLSPTDRKQIDDWIGAFFADHIMIEQGFYKEPGLPNSYDLFTRLHLAELLVEGYDGLWREPLERLLETGLRRSLAVQLSDGSLASAHRSTGQTWTLGAQIALFTHTANLLTDSTAAARARDAANRAYASMIRWQRTGDVFSPVENVLPPNYRVGYEGYTSDGHYSSLALGFLATAVHAGFTGPSEAVTAERPASIHCEHEPTFRALAHRDRFSVHVDADPAPAYDGFGITDVTFGPGRLLQFCSSVRHVRSGAFFNLGLAHRDGPGRRPLAVIATEPLTLSEPIDGAGTAGLRLRARAQALPTESRSERKDPPPLTPAYALDVDIEPDRIRFHESTPGLADHKSLLIPYLRDPGAGATTTVAITGREITLTLGTEAIAVTVDADVEHVIHLPHGYENRRGLCGLIRVDLRAPADGISYDVRVVS